MKYKNILTCSILMLGILSSKSYAQQTHAYRQASSEKLIPKLVTSKFKEQYPNVLLRGWYVTHLTYWQNDISAGWYSNWYGQRTVTVYSFQKPTYFEVEFIDQPGEVSRAIYNLNGYWYETRTQIKGLTMGIYDALKVSEFYNWEISPTMEKLVSPMWSVEIYRFHVSKDFRSYIIRMDAEGNTIQIKQLND